MDMVKVKALIKQIPFMRYVTAKLRHRSIRSVWSEIITDDRKTWEEALRQAQDSSKVLMATSLGGFKHASFLESILSVALTLRGAQVDVLLCDSVLPACMATDINNTSVSQLLKRFPQLRCEYCDIYGKKLFAPLNLPTYFYSKLITDDQRYEAKAISKSVSLDNFADYKFNGLAVGEHALAGALRYFAVGDLKMEPEGETVLRKYIEAAILTVYVLEELLNRKQYDVVCFTHGLYVPYGLIGEVCRKKGVRVVNWNPAYRKQTFIFSHDDTYHHTMISEPTKEWETVEWTPDLKRITMDYLKSRWQGTRDWIWFHEKPIEDIDQITNELGIDFSKPCIGMLTNVIWDAQLHYKSRAFNNMIEWVIKTIQYFEKRPEIQLIIRIHPAEIRGMLPSRQAVLAEINKVFPKLASNVYVIPPESHISTYALMQKCDSVIIYNTKTGIEISSMSIPVIVAGEAWIRNKGFSLDASSPEEYFRILDKLPLNKVLDKSELERAQKYAFHFFFRKMIELPFIDSPQKYEFGIKIKDIKELMPNKFKGLDVICNGILNGTSFIYHKESDE